MELQFYGANCLRMQSKSAAIVVDDNLVDVGLKKVTKEGDIVLFTDIVGHKSAKQPKIVIDQPGEYEVSNVSIQGVAVRSHMDEPDKRSATMYKITLDDIKIVVTGHIYPELTDDELEQIGMVDILIIPVGGNGYTLDGVGALKIIKKIEPKLVIPTHFADKAIKYEVPQQPLEDALKQMSMEPAETVPRLKIKGSEIPEATNLIVLERQ